MTAGTEQISDPHYYDLDEAQRGQLSLEHQVCLALLKHGELQDVVQSNAELNAVFAEETGTDLEDREAKKRLGDAVRKARSQGLLGFEIISLSEVRPSVTELGRTTIDNAIRIFHL